MYFNFQKEVDDKFKFKLLSPFGPRIGHIKLNDSFIKTMIEITDNILKDKNKEYFGKSLAGRIHEEIKISINLMKSEGIYNAICNYQDYYLSSIFPRGYFIKGEHRKLKTEISSAWIVSQYEGEYNPPHWHDSCTISSVMYLKIPEYVPRNIPNKEESDGDIDFINNACVPLTSLENPTQSFQPQVGDMFIFPSRLIHCVHPFIGPGERRSVSVNAFHLAQFDD
mgnify:CR=1 FL=1